MLGSPVDLGLNPRRVNLPCHQVRQGLNVLASLALTLVQLLQKIIVGIRFQELERQVVQLDLHLADTQPLRQRGVDLHGLAGLLLLLGGRHEL